ncbi:hypothetical protein KVT40_004544 [Elsinoe batatas]|uniref:Uncharacterized protein n=1 Tax=Elsinoe batatas TaxID=2601811 RepID=A0A8K0PES2_9PEZI|nr:hypothetical protein KVT40_004544 [Elsinoe batatas]
MSSKQAVKTSKVLNGLPNVLNQAIIAGGTVYCSGQVATSVETGKLVEGTVGDRTKQCLRNLQLVLEAAGSSIDNVVKVNVFLDDMANFAAMNEVYQTWFGEVKPCRTCVAVKQLPMGTDVEIECIATLGRAKL